MPFVRRDQSGAIVAVSKLNSTECDEYVEDNNVELVEFVHEFHGARSDLSETDQDFVRVLEDVVELLIQKGLILFTDLPPSAQKKVMNRQSLRQKVGQKLDLIEED